MTEHLFDNRSDERKVFTWLKHHLAPDAHLRVASAYFSIYAFESLKDQLQKLGKVQFLFGDPDFLKNLDPGRPEAAFSLVDGQLKLSEQIQQNALAKECADWIEQKVDVRSVRDGRLAHGKMYHLAPPAGEEKHALFQMREAALMGSSNFTRRGIGGTQSPNIELNMVIDDDRDRIALRKWFDDVWKDDEFTEDVKEKVLSHLHQLSRDNAPEWVYFVTLWHLFKNRIANRMQDDAQQDITGWKDSQIYNALYSFQKHGAHGAIDKLQKYNGCILADSVGLGKTFEALAIIKYFELRRENVLVLCPKKLRENWELYQRASYNPLNPFSADAFQYALLSHTDLSREKGEAGSINLANFRWQDFGLVVIDESHNFRNNSPGKRGEDGEIIRKSRYARLIEDVIGGGIKTKVLLLSATPVNTDLRDLRNQLHLISAGRSQQFDDATLDAAFDESLGIPSLTNLINQSQREFNAWAQVPREQQQPPQRDARQLLSRLPSSLFTLLDELSIARSREHIRRFYSDDLQQIGAFPERLKPASFSPDIDLRGEFPSYDILHEDISQYQLSLFKPSQYVKPEFRERYLREKVRNFSQESRETFLIGMMRVNFLKRLESSVHSFHESMRRTIEKIDALILRIEEYRTVRSENAEFNLEDVNFVEDDPEATDAFEVTAVGYKMDHLDVETWIKDLRADRMQLSRLAQHAEHVTPERDAKLAQLKAFIAERCKNAGPDKTGRINKKVLLFTAYADTARYLYDNLHAWLQREEGMHCALVVGSGSNATTFGSDDFNAILTNFSPVSKKRGRLEPRKLAEITGGEFRDEAPQIDFLVASDCISEGQNLQDCGRVINYDIHWNPVRLVQRFGRVDRLGSLHDQIQMVNFWPTEDLNRYIKLKYRVEARMALVDLAGSNQDNVLSGPGSDAESKAKEIIESDLDFRDHQLLRLRDETPELDEMQDNVSLSEFTLDDFIQELLAFLENNKAALERAPLGIFAVTKCRPDVLTPPGIIWCLRRRDGMYEAGTSRTIARGAVNRFAPYYLIYIKEDESDFVAFDQEKRMLSVLRALCSGHKEPWDKGCREFDQENTADGMRQVVTSLEAATRIIAQLAKTSSASSLARGGTITKTVAKMDEQLDGWDLISWVVVREERG